MEQFIEASVLSNKVACLVHIPTHRPPRTQEVPCQEVLGLLLSAHYTDYTDYTDYADYTGYTDNLGTDWDSLPVNCSGIKEVTQLLTGTVGNWKGLENMCWRRTV